MIGDVLSLLGTLLILFGAILSLSAGVGLVRFRDSITRMHPAAKPQVLGLIAVLTGAGLRLQKPAEVGVLVLACLFAVITAPVVANRVSNVAYHESGKVRREGTDPLEDA
ncbi:cation:proton antiporter [Dietzia sp.]|uniref:cation:proton antiporter n=1 Tax=Dietzia sp. TaxID=1871616 RepID=UPI002FDA724F